LHQTSNRFLDTHRAPEHLRRRIQLSLKEREKVNTGQADATRAQTMIEQRNPGWQSAGIDRCELASIAAWINPSTSFSMRYTMLMLGRDDDVEHSPARLSQRGADRSAEQGRKEGGRLWPPGRKCIDSSGLNVRFLPGPSSSADNPEITQAELAQVLAVERSRIVPILNKLEELRLAQRLVCDADKRNRRIVLTPKRHKLLAELKRRFAMGGDKDRLLAMLRKVSTLSPGLTDGEES
jgi:hypothetical protein